MNEDAGVYKKDNELIKRELHIPEQEKRILSLKIKNSLDTINSSSSISHRFLENDSLDNLNSLTISLKEKESVTELRHTSIRRIDYVKNKWKLHTAGSHCNMKMDISTRERAIMMVKNELTEKKYMPPKLEKSIDSNRNLLHKDKASANLKVAKVKNMYEDQIKLIKNHFKSSQFDLQYILRSAQASLQSKHIELETILENQRMTVNLVQKLGEDIVDLQNKHVEMERTKNELKIMLASRDKIISKMKFLLSGVKRKVKDACHVVRQAMKERDAALVREKEAQDEIVKLMQTLGYAAKDSIVVMSPCQRNWIQESDSVYLNDEY